METSEMKAKGDGIYVCKCTKGKKGKYCGVGAI